MSERAGHTEKNGRENADTLAAVPTAALREEKNELQKKQLDSAKIKIRVSTVEAFLQCIGRGG